MSAKDILLKPIDSKTANAFVKRVHYSGKVVQNSTVHIGVFYNGNLEGVMQFGSPLDKRKVLPLVRDTLWNEMLELNRMAFTDILPRNSESRALSIAFKLLRKHAPHIKWILSFADATQCGDGAIYRASGFALTGIKENGQLYRLPRADHLDEKPLIAKGLTNNDVSVLRAWLRSIEPQSGNAVMQCMTAKFHPFPTERDNGQLVYDKLTIEDRPGNRNLVSVHKIAIEGHPHAHKMSLEGGVRPNALLSEVKQIMRRVTNGGTSADKLFTLMGGYPAEGYQLRYIYFLDATYRERLTVPIVPFSQIDEIGARMYKGEKTIITRA